MSIAEGEKVIGSKDILQRGYIKPKDFRDSKDWEFVEKSAGEKLDHVVVPSFYNFDPVGVIPFQAPMDQIAHVKNFSFYSFCFSPADSPQVPSIL